MRVLGLFLLLASLLIGGAFAQGEEPRLEALKKYVLEQDYPEVFGTSQYKMRIEGVVDADVDNDGSKELVVLYFPHYRQSAPIVIYKISPTLKVVRAMEGLAPGPLQKLSEEYLDSHAVGNAADIQISTGNAKPEEILKIMAKNGLNGIVVYDTFYHIDGRTGFPSFVDMRGVKLPPNNQNCSLFEFSRVRQIAIGHLREDSSRNYLAAWVGDEIYVYLIQGISNEGLLDKKSWAILIPRGFRGFETGQGLAYNTESGKQILTLK